MALALCGPRFKGKGRKAASLASLPSTTTVPQPATPTHNPEPRAHAKHHQPLSLSMMEGQRQVQTTANSRPAIAIAYCNYNTAPTHRQVPATLRTLRFLELKLKLKLKKNKRKTTTAKHNHQNQKKTKPRTQTRKPKLKLETRNQGQGV